MRRSKKLTRSAFGVAAGTALGVVLTPLTAGAQVPLAPGHFPAGSTQETYKLVGAWGNYGWYPAVSAANWNNTGHEGPHLQNATGTVAIEINFADTTTLRSVTHDRFDINSAPPADASGVWLANRLSITISRGQMTPGRYGAGVDVDAYYYGPNVHEIGHALGLNHPTDAAISGPGQCAGKVASSMHGHLSVSAYCNWYQPQGADVTTLNGIYK